MKTIILLLGLVQAAHAERTAPREQDFTYLTLPTTFTVKGPQTNLSTITVVAQNAAGYSLALSSGLSMPNGTLTANAIAGEGSQVRNVQITTSNVQGKFDEAHVAGSTGMITSGSFPVERLPGTVAYTNFSNNFSSNQYVNGALGTTGSITSGSTITATGQDAAGYSLKLSSGINMPAGTVNAGLFVGSGVGLTGLTASSGAFVRLSGDVMYGPLTVYNSSVTVTYGLIAGSGTFSAQVTASSANFTASGTNQYSLVLASGIYMSDGLLVTRGIRFTGDSSISTSAALPGSTGSGSSTTNNIFYATGTINWATDNFLPQATGTQTSFVLSQTPSSPAGVFVVVDGFLQSATSDYTFTPPQTISFTTAPAPGSSSFFATYTINTSTIPAAAILTATQTFTGQNFFAYMSSYSIVLSSGIEILTGGMETQYIKWRDGSVSTSAALPGSGAGSGGAGNVTWVQDNFLTQANGVNKVFTLSQTPASSSGTLVVVDGFLQSGTSDYVFTLPQTITFTTAPAAGSSSFFVAYTVNTSTIPGAAILTATQTFSGTNYNQGFVTVNSTYLPAGYIFQVGGTTFSVTASGHVEFGGPSVPTANLATCGITPSIVGNDMVGKITLGTGGATACVMTFVSVWNKEPSCNVTNETTANLMRATSTTSQVTFSGTGLGGDVLAYECQGRR